MANLQVDSMLGHFLSVHAVKGSKINPSSMRRPAGETTEGTEAE